MDSGAYLLTRHDPALVLAALLVATFASFVTLEMAHQVLHDRRHRRGWWAAGALAMGSGVWAMHFVAMLGFEAGIALGYRTDLTLLSWVAACLAATVALRVAACERVSALTILGASLSMAVGICAMHYLGMAAVAFSPGIVWSRPLVVASALVAWTVSATALLIFVDRKSTRLNSSHSQQSRMPSSA